ncbi:MAG: hypothetical protein H6739_25850 [Alphaproteobacteria bacterium]|nr:hypothetical protein [Alphaproteobacteria bacterium]
MTHLLVSFLLSPGLASAQETEPDEQAETSSAPEPLEHRLVEAERRLAEAERRAAEAERAQLEAEKRLLEAENAQLKAALEARAVAAPLPEPSAAPAPAPAPAPPPAAGLAPVVTVGGEVHVNLIAARLDNLHPDVPEDPSLSFRINRGFLWWDTELAEGLHAYTRIDIRQDFSTWEYAFEDGLGEALTLSIPRESTTWQLRLQEAWVRWDTARLGTVRVGLGNKRFGVRDWYDSKSAYFMGGPPPGFFEPERRYGVVPPKVLGVSWERGFGDLVDVVVQVTNTAGHTAEELRVGKDVVGRVQLTPIDGLLASGSVLYGPRGDEGSQLAWAAAVHYGPGRTRGVVEVIGNRVGDTRQAIGMLTAAHDLPLGAERLDHITFLGRAMGIDPDNAAEQDMEAALAAAVDLYWATRPKAELLTGLFYESTLPQDLTQAIQHNATLQMVVRF